MRGCAVFFSIFCICIVGFILYKHGEFKEANLVGIESSFQGSEKYTVVVSKVHHTRYRHYYEYKVGDDTYLASTTGNSNDAPNSPLLTLYIDEEDPSKYYLEDNDGVSFDFMLTMIIVIVAIIAGGFAMKELI